MYVCNLYVIIVQYEMTSAITKAKNILEARLNMYINIWPRGQSLKYV